MATDARWDMAFRRNNVRTFTIRLAGVDMTGKTMRQQVRLAPDTPGAPVIALETVTSASAEGMRLASVETVDGVPVSTIVGRYNLTTMRDKLPYGGEVGDDYPMVHEIELDGVTRFYGRWTARGTVMDSETAPLQREPLSTRVARATSDTENLTATIAGDEVFAVTLDGAPQLGPLVDRATSAAEQSTAERIAAQEAALLAQQTAAKPAGVLADFAVTTTTKTKQFGPGHGGSTYSGVWRRFAVLDKTGSVTGFETRTAAAGTFRLAVVRPTGPGEVRVPVAQVTLTSLGTSVALYAIAAGLLDARPGDELFIGAGTTQYAISNDSGGTGVTFTGDLVTGQPFTPTRIDEGSRPRGVATMTYPVTTYEPARYTTSVASLAAASVWGDGTVANAQDPEGIFRKVPAPVPPDGTVNDAKRYRDAVTLVPPPNTTVLAFANSSTNWGAAPQKTAGIGVRLPTAAYTGGNKVEAFCLNFLNGTTDTSQSTIAWNTGTLAPDKRSVTFGAARTLVTDSIGSINKLVNPCAGWRPHDGGVLLFSRDARGDVPNLKLFELGFDTAGNFTKGIGGVPFAVGGTDAGAREVQGVIPPDCTRAYMCPQAIVTLPDQTYIAPGWGVVGTSYRIWLLKRGVADGEWVNFWTIAEGQAGIPNSNRVQGEQSVTPLKNGNLHIVDRRTFINNVGARAWWDVDLNGNIVASGLYVGLFDVAIGVGTCRLDDGHILAVGPRLSAGSGQNDLGFHAAVSYDEGATFADTGPDLRNMSKPGRSPRYLFDKADTGAPVPESWSPPRTGNSVLVPIGGGLALGLYEGRGPTTAGTFGDYVQIGAQIFGAASAIRNAEPWENL